MFPALGYNIWVTEYNTIIAALCSQTTSNLVLDKN